MKRRVTILMIVSFLLVCGGLTSYGQTKEEEEKKKQEMLMQEKIEKEKQKALEERERIIIHRDELDKAVREARDAYREQWKLAEPSMIYAPGFENVEGIYFMGGSPNSSSLQFSKVVKEGNFTKEMKFEIDEDAKRASINVTGMCEEGEILVVITQPSGKKYTEVLIDEYGSVNWSKSFSLDEENGTKAGEWAFKVTARNATGNFRLSLKSY